ncbi:MAG: sporulation initiation factor Spo0A C-terminal domain-containing protein [Clostridia bacterium]|nr:sporulation initiation factor Spo0A C-terminal domain-containing protein [Clostridia bacterium]
MDMFRLCWPEGGSGMLLLVAVDAHSERMEGAVPCRVVGRVTAGSPFAQAEEQSPPARVASLLTAVGVPTNLRGYGYLRTALTLALEQPEVLRGLGRRLYPAIAREHGASASAVERGIRHAVAVTWERGGGERCRQLMGRAFSCVADCPSNGEFLTLLAQWLTLHREIPAG